MSIIEGAGAVEIAKNQRDAKQGRKSLKKKRPDTKLALNGRLKARWRISASDREADPAAARGGRVRVLHAERLAHEVVDEVELGAPYHFERDGVDDHDRTVAGGDEVVLGAGLLDVEGVLEARAAAALDRDAQRRAFFALKDGVQPSGGARADRHGVGGRGGYAHERSTSVMAAGRRAFKKLPD
jgi:hypothetical protein